jgi:predicted GNAT family N-acyltransferase
MQSPDEKGRMPDTETIIETDFAKDRERIMRVRTQVFVQEQGVPPELEEDEKDPACVHALLLIDSEPAATGRLERDGHIGRIAVMRSHRGKGFGSRILAYLEKRARQQGLTRVYLGAQVQAIPFYEKSGYRCYGDTFLDAGITHRHMEKSL